MQDELNYWQRSLSRRMSRRSMLKVGAGAGLGLAAIAAGCSQPQQQKTEVAPSGAKTPKSGGIFRVSQSTDPPNLDPQLHGVTVGANFSGKVYSRLVVWKQGPGVKPDDDTIVGDLAEKWEQPDPTTYIFTLRPGIKWHDIPPVNGRELVADDVKYTYDRLMDPKTQNNFRGYYSPIQSVTAVDKSKVKFTTAEPLVTFWSSVTHTYSAYIVPKEAVEKFGDLKKNAIGTGPFILDTYDRNIKLTLKKNPNYFIKGRPYIDGIEWKFIPDESTRKAAFFSGEIDTNSAKVTEIDEFKKAVPDVQIEKTASSVSYGMLPNCERKPFDDVRVRSAMRYAIDYQRMIDTLHLGQGVQEGLIPPLLEKWSLPLDEIKKQFRLDLPKAKQLMAEAGLPNGFKSDIYTSSAYGQQAKDMCQMLMQDLKQIGIELEFRIVEYAQHQKDWLSSNYNLYAGPLRGNPDPNEFTYESLHPKGARWFTRYKDDKMIALVEKQRKQFNEAERKQTIFEIQRYFAEVVPEIPLPVGYGFSAQRGYVKDYPYHFDRSWGDPGILSIWLDK